MNARKRFLPPLACLFLALVFAGAGSMVETIACERATGTCRWSRTDLYRGAEERSFAIGDVREVRFVDGLGKNKRRAESVLVLASGHELRLATDEHEPARERFLAMQRFFAGEGPSLRDDTKGSPFMFVVALGAAVAFAHFLRRALRG